MKISVRNSFKQKTTCLLYMLLGIFFLMGLPYPVSAQEADIIAIVNKDIVTKYDVNQRIQLMMQQSGGRLSSSAKRRLEKQILKSLIDEKIKLQEAEEADIEIEEAIIEERFRSLAESNRMDVGQFEAVLSNANIDADNIRDRIRADMAWFVLVRKKLSRRIRISDEDVALEIRRQKQNINQPRVDVSEIFLPIEDPTASIKTKRRAEDLRNQIVGGLQFNAAAEQFSSGPTASQGGSVGWVTRGRYSPEIDSILFSLKPGDLSPPLEVSGGVLLLKINDRREGSFVDPLKISVDLKQIIFPFDLNNSDESKAAAHSKAQTTRIGISSCTTFDAAVSQGGPGSGPVGRLFLGDLPPLFRDAVSELSVEQVSQPIESPQGVHLLIVCDRVVPEIRLPTETETRERLRQQLLASHASRFLRELRDDAFVELR